MDAESLPTGEIAVKWNPKKNGYIGITRDLAKRWTAHCKDPYMGQKIRENGLDFGDMRILKGGLSKAEAYHLEKKYRPKPNIGWNRKSGGGGIEEGQSYYLYHIAPRRGIKHYVIWPVVIVLAIILLV